MGNQLKIFTWYIHPNYLFYLAQGNYTIYIPSKPKKTVGYYYKGEPFPFDENVIEIPSDEVKLYQFDCVVFQNIQNYLHDQFEIFSEEQRTLPQIYLEHDPPYEHPTDTKHPVNDPSVTLVHVTHFNNLMWDNNKTPTCVIEHGVTQLPVNYSGKYNKGIVVINNLPLHKRLLGMDIFLEVRKQIPIDLVDIGNGEFGLDEIPHFQLPEFISQYRFFFDPTRYTSLSLTTCEAMMTGIPVVGFATNELSTIIDNGYSGHIHTDVNYLIDKMKLLLNDAEYAREIGENGHNRATEKFNINRFTHQWEKLFKTVINKQSPSVIMKQ